MRAGIEGLATVEMNQRAEERQSSHRPLFRNKEPKETNTSHQRKLLRSKNKEETQEGHNQDPKRFFNRTQQDSYNHGGHRPSSLI
jgi:hypothetical protein